jgi:hypothetical protein
MMEDTEGYQLETVTSTIVHPKPNIITTSELSHVKWVLFHYGMASHQVLDGDCFHILNVWIYGTK